MSIRRVGFQYLLIITVTALPCPSCSGHKNPSSNGVSRASTSIPDGQLITIEGETTLTAEYRGPDQATLISSHFGIYDGKAHKSYQLVLPDGIELVFGKKYKLTGIVGVAINPKQVSQGYQGVYLLFVKEALAE